jgi:hypothetical protein
MDRDRLLQERLGALVGTGREDWKDVRRRARAHGYRRTHYAWIAAALLTAALAIAAAPPLVMGKSVLDLFRDPSNPELPRTSFHPVERLEWDKRYGDWSVRRVASDGRTTFYALHDARGEVVCVMHGRADWVSASGRFPFGSVTCADPGTLLSPAKPLYYQVTVQSTIHSHGPRPWRVTGVAADGVDTIVLTGTGDRIEIPVEDHAFTITEFPNDAQSIEIAAIDADGRVLQREPLSGFGPVPDAPPTGSPPVDASPSPPDRPLEPRRGERPIQQGRARDAELRVFRDGLVVFRIARASPATRLVSSNYSCLRFTEIDGETHPVWVGGSGDLAPDGTSLKGRASRPLVDPPYDGCEVHGDFGRRWNDPRGTRSPVEVPLTAAGREYFDTRAAARDLAEFLRSPRIVALRRRLRADNAATYPQAEVIRRGLPRRVLALASPAAGTRPSQIGVWSESRRLVVATRSQSGERLFVELDGGRIAQHNLRDLARLS